MTTAKAPDSSFKTRLRSALMLAPPVLLLIYVGGGGFALMMAVAAGIAGYEWAKMVLAKEAHPALVQMTSALLAISVVAVQMISSPVGGFIFLLALCFLIFAFNFSRKGPSLRLLLGGFVYCGFAIQLMVWIRNDTEHGLFNILTLLLIVWASDICAYLSGRAIGGPKLAPSISPKKTWAGFFGSSIGAGLVAGALACPWAVESFGVATLGGLGPLGYFIMGFILAMFGQAGDLLISLFKRHFGVKDTGNLIPGHGGILDRIDALLLVALIFGAIVRVTG